MPPAALTRTLSPEAARFASMHASARFSVTEFTPSDYVSPVTTGIPVGHAHMVKAFAHSATTDGQSPERLNELLVIAPGSGSGELVGITGTGHLVIDEDGTHHVELDYDLPQ